MHMYIFYPHPHPHPTHTHIHTPSLSPSLSLCFCLSLSVSVSLCLTCQPSERKQAAPPIAGDVAVLVSSYLQNNAHDSKVYNVYANQVKGSGQPLLMLVMLLCCSTTRGRTQCLRMNTSATKQKSASVVPSGMPPRCVFVVVFHYTVLPRTASCCVYFVVVFHYTVLPRTASCCVYFVVVFHYTVLPRTASCCVYFVVVFHYTVLLSYQEQLLAVCILLLFFTTLSYQEQLLAVCILSESSVTEGIIHVSVQNTKMIIIMEICEMPTLQLKVLNKHNITYNVHQVRKCYQQFN